MTGAWRLAAGTVVLAGALILGACGGSDSSGPKSATTIDQGQAASIGSSVASQIGSITSGLTSFSTPAVGGFSGLGIRSLPGRLLTNKVKSYSPRIQASLAKLDTASTCNPTVSDTTDTDGDGIYDNAIVTFTGHCTEVDSASTTTVTGSVHIVDTDSPTTFFGYAVGLNALAITITDTSGTSLAIGFGGTFGVGVSAATATGTQDVQTALRVNNTLVFNDHANWAVSYTPTGGNIPNTSTQLPAGALAFNGSYSFAGDAGTTSNNWTFAIGTTTPLAYNGSCLDDTWPFDSGQLTVAISANATVGFTVDYAGCGVAGTVTAF